MQPLHCQLLCRKQLRANYNTLYVDNTICETSLTALIKPDKNPFYETSLVTSLVLTVFWAQNMIGGALPSFFATLSSLFRNAYQFTAGLTKLARPGFEPTESL